MADYFFDTSALVKRHVIEAGSPWVKSLVRAKAAHTLYIARITAVEVTSRSPAGKTAATFLPPRPARCSGISAAT
jgi:hypothetical protein